MINKDVCVTALKFVNLSMKCLRHPVARLLTRLDDVWTCRTWFVRSGRPSCVLRLTLYVGRGDVVSLWCKRHQTVSTVCGHCLWCLVVSYECHKGWMSLAGDSSGVRFRTKCSHQTHRQRCIYKNICIFLQFLVGGVNSEMCHYFPGTVCACGCEVRNNTSANLCGFSWDFPLVEGW